MITTRGPNGSNVMAAEWVTQISYHPTLIAIFIHKGSVTLENILKTKEFGINIASQEQISEVSVAGGYSGNEIDKIGMKNIFQITTSVKIKTPMIAGCVINAECKLVKWQKLGDHTMIVGQVLDMRYDDSKSPLIYHKGRYMSLGPILEPERKIVNVSNDVLQFFTNLARGRFVLKCVGVMIKSKNKVLVMKWQKDIETIPFNIPPKGQNQRNCLIEFLHESGLNFEIGKIPCMKRLILMNGGNMQRINFVLFKGKSTKTIKAMLLKSPKEDRLISELI